MGYYTDFKLKVSPDVAAEIMSDFEAFNAIFEELTNYTLEDDLTMGGVKWYDHDKNMIELSKLYPDAIWQVDGVGEEDGDIWRTYYMNGKSQSANTKVVVTYDEFDVSKLR